MDEQCGTYRDEVCGDMPLLDGSTGGSLLSLLRSPSEVASLFLKTWRQRMLPVNVLRVGKARNLRQEYDFTCYPEMPEGM